MKSVINFMVKFKLHLKCFLILNLIVNLFCIPVYALELDTSIDDEIRKNYNPNKLEEDVGLPPLPKILDDSASPVTKTLPQKTSQVVQKKVTTANTVNISNVQKKDVVQKTSVQTPKETYIVKQEAKVEQTLTKIDKNNFQQNITLPEDKYIILKHGTRVNLKLLTSISDRTKRGSKVDFVSIYPVTATYYTIPTGTIFRGKVIQSHKPQITGNGGLIVIEVTSVIINGKSQHISTFVARANRKFIFFNKIKGKRKYISNTFKSMRPGVKFSQRMLSTSQNLMGDGSTMILVPFAIIIGALGFCGNVILSPAISLFQKGDSIHFEQGSHFIIKFDQDIYITP